MTAVHDAPYVGLRPYDLADTERFFGRDDESLEVRDALFSGRLLVVYGRPWVGKTSLIQAGVLPKITSAKAHVLPVARLRPVSPVPPARGSPSAFRREVLAAWAPDLSTEMQHSTTITGFIRRVPVMRDRYGEDELPMIAIIDQLEVALAAEHWREARDQLFDDLVQAMDEFPHLHLLLCLRHESLGEILPYEPDLAPAGQRARYQVRPLEEKHALEAIRGPLRTTPEAMTTERAMTLVDSLTRTAVADESGARQRVALRDVSPLRLQLACLGFQGDSLDAALTAYCEQAVGAVASTTGFERGELWRWLDEGFTAGTGVNRGAYRGLLRTAGMPNQVADECAARGLLRSEDAAGLSWFLLQTDGLVPAIRRARSRGTPGPTVDGYFRMAQTALHSHAFDVARGHAEEAVAAAPPDPVMAAEAYLFLAQVNAMRGDHTKTIEAFRQAARLLRAAVDQDEDDIALRLGLADTLRDAERVQDAVEQYTEVLERDPGCAHARVERAYLKKQQIAWAYNEVKDVSYHLLTARQRAMVDEIKRRFLDNH